HLREEALVVGRHALALALVGDDLHLASVEHEVLVDEALERLVEHDALAVALVEALGLEDGVDLGAVVREVVDDRDRVGGDAPPPALTAPPPAPELRVAPAAAWRLGALDGTTAMISSCIAASAASGAYRLANEPVRIFLLTPSGSPRPVWTGVHEP